MNKEIENEPIASLFDLRLTDSTGQTQQSSTHTHTDNEACWNRGIQEIPNESRATLFLHATTCLVFRPWKCARHTHPWPKWFTLPPSACAGETAP